MRFYIDFLMEQKSYAKAVQVLKDDKQLELLPHDRKQLLAECLMFVNDTTSVEQANAIYGHLLVQFKFVIVFFHVF